MRTGVLVLLMVLSACGDTMVESVTTTSPNPVNRALTYLALGDSYTIGESVPARDRFPIQLVDALADEGIAIPAPVVIARTGWTTSELDAGVDRADPQGPFDLVTLLIGVNNQFRGLSIDEYREEFAALLRRSIDFAGGNAARVIVVSIPDWGVTPFAEGRDRKQITEEIDAFNAVAEEEALAVGAHWVNITPISRSDSPGLVASDGLHPSAEQYRLWVELITPVALRILGP